MVEEDLLSSTEITEGTVVALKSWQVIVYTSGLYIYTEGLKLTWGNSAFFPAIYFSYLIACVNLRDSSQADYFRIQFYNSL